jgi:hypothetical protein
MTNDAKVDSGTGRTRVRLVAEPPVGDPPDHLSMIWLQFVKISRAIGDCSAWRQNIAERLVARGAGYLATTETERLLGDIWTAIVGFLATIFVS